MASDGQDATTTPSSGQTSRRARLWLGYSAERLRNIGDLEARRARKNASKTSVSLGSMGRLGQYDEEASDFGTLDEVAVSAPFEPIPERRSLGPLQDRIQQSMKETVVDGDVPALPQKAPYSRLATELYTISYLIFFSILGTLARVGLQALTFYPGAPVQTGLLWANVGGSLIMGFLAEDRSLFREEWGGRVKDTRHHKHEMGAEYELERTAAEGKRHGAVKKTLPLYIGLATGFCGSFTSFSSFIRDVFYALTNALPVPINHPSLTPISQTINVHRNPGYSFMATLAILIATVGLSLGSLQVGAHLALGTQRIIPSIPFSFSRKLLDPLMLLVGWGAWTGAIIMTLFPPDRPGGPIGNATWGQEIWRGKVLFALVFAPPGCLLRFYVSLWLNKAFKSFPLGTFMVNVFGTAVEAMFIDLQRVPLGGRVGCQILQGLSDGFCGCLTTVSTWVLELKGLRLKHAYFYAIMSMGIGLAFMVVIIGSLLWTQGFAPLLCTT